MQQLLFMYGILSHIFQVFYLILHKYIFTYSIDIEMARDIFNNTLQLSISTDQDNKTKNPLFLHLDLSKDPKQHLIWEYMQHMYVG